MITIVTAVGEITLNATFQPVQLNLGETDTGALDRADGSRQWVRRGDNLPTPAPFVVAGTIQSEQRNIAAMRAEANAIVEAARSAQEVLYITSAGAWAYEVQGGRFPRFTQRGADRYQQDVVLEFWATKDIPEFRTLSPFNFGIVGVATAIKSNFTDITVPVPVEARFGDLLLFVGGARAPSGRDITLTGGGWLETSGASTFILTEIQNAYQFSAYKWYDEGDSAAVAITVNAEITQGAFGIIAIRDAWKTNDQAGAFRNPSMALPSFTPEQVGSILLAFYGGISRNTAAFALNPQTGWGVTIDETSAPGGTGYQGQLYVHQRDARTALESYTYTPGVVGSSVLWLRGNFIAVRPGLVPGPLTGVRIFPLSFTGSGATITTHAVYGNVFRAEDRLDVTKLRFRSPESAVYTMEVWMFAPNPGSKFRIARVSVSTVATEWVEVFLLRTLKFYEGAEFLVCAYKASGNGQTYQFTDANISSDNKVTRVTSFYSSDRQNPTVFEEVANGYQIDIGYELLAGPVPDPDPDPEIKLLLFDDGTPLILDSGQPAEAS